MLFPHAVERPTDLVNFLVVVPLARGTQHVGGHVVGLVYGTRYVRVRSLGPKVCGGSGGGGDCESNERSEGPVLEPNRAVQGWSVGSSPSVAVGRTASHLHP